MPKSKHRSSHKIKVVKYKDNKKREQELLKKKMLDNYIKMQKEALANQEMHTSTEEVIGPEINVDELNQIEDWEPIKTEQPIADPIDVNVNINVEPLTEEINDNDNK